MEEQNYRKKRGNRWSFLINIKNKANWTPRDCTDFDSIMVLKRSRRSSAPVVLLRHITWENRAQGIGRYIFTPGETRDIIPRDYAYECYLYKDDESENETIAKGTITVVPTVKTAITPRT